MSDEELDAAASTTYTQEAGTIRLNGYIVIDNRPCQVIHLARGHATSKLSPNYLKVKCQFVGLDVFTGKEHVVIVPSTHMCDVPHVNRADYQLIGISEDGFVRLLTGNGVTKDDVRLPTDDSLRTLIEDGYAVGKELVLSVISAMGEEQIYKVKNIGGRKRIRRESVVSATAEKQICV